MEAKRVDVLAVRVRWLDRYRRPLSVSIAFACWLALMVELHSLMGDKWVAAVPTGIATLFSIAAWWLVEAAFAWLTAMWEAEHDRIARDRGLPRAEIVRR